VALLAITAIVAARGGRRFSAALAALLVFASITALWSVTRIADAIIDHEVFWISGFGVLGTAVLLDAALAAGGERRGRASPRVTSILCGVAVCLAAVIGVFQLRLVVDQTLSPRAQQRAAAALAEALKERIRTVAGRPSVRIEQDAWPVAAGVLLNLQKSGVPFAVEDNWLPMFSDAAAATGGETEVIEIAGRQRHVLLTGEGRAVTIAEARPFYVLLLTPAHK
jgi:4-amino-4-deoxy-L-arabinose transferase-like glycosyltransferase